MGRELDQMDKLWPRDLPSRCHPCGPVHRQCVLSEQRGVGDLIDFYFACTDAYAYDLVICLNAWCFEPDLAFNVTKARALGRRLSERAPAGGAEIDALPLLARGASIRFLGHPPQRLADVPEGALVVPKDPREYATKLAFHQGVYDARFYGLDFD
jgi:homoserine kinase type II